MNEGGCMKGAALGVLLSVLSCACAAPGPPASGRVGELRGRIVRIERDQGLIAVAPKSDEASQWLKLVPFTSVRGSDTETVDALHPGQRVYVRYLSEPLADPPEVLSITVIRYTLEPRGAGLGSVQFPGF